VAIELETDSATTKDNKQLAIKLRAIINGETDKNILESLQKELREYNNSPEEVYNQNREIIEATLTEIADEISRREQSTEEQNKVPVLIDNQSKSPVKPNKRPVSPVVIVAGIILLLTFITFLGYRVFSLRKKATKKKLK